MAKKEPEVIFEGGSLRLSVSGTQAEVVEPSLPEQVERCVACGSKMKVKKAAKLRPATGESQKRDNVTASTEDYFVGQVANSLFQNKPKVCDTNPLLQLFSTPRVERQPVYVAVPKAAKKRKHVEEKIATEVQHSSAKGEPFKKTKKSKKKDLSLAELSVASRECALGKADEEEEKKEKQIKEKLKNRHSQQSGVNPAEEMLKNKRTLFVGNLPVTCTAQMLKSFFKEFGQIESIRFRSLIPAEDGLSKKMAAIKRKVHPNMKYINAYVVFKEECAANNALKRNGTEFSSGFHIRVDLASQATSHDNKKSVFVGNLSYEIDDETVRNHFSECGNVMGVRIVRDRNTGIGKGFGYVLFETADAVHLALKLNNSELNGRKLRVQRCVKKEKSHSKHLVKNVKRPVGLKYGNNSSLTNTKRGSNGSFAGEKADPMKKSKKTKVKIITKKKPKKSK